MRFRTVAAWRGRDPRYGLTRTGRPEPEFAYGREALAIFETPLPQFAVKRADLLPGSDTGQKVPHRRLFHFFLGVRISDPDNTTRICRRQRRL